MRRIESAVSISPTTMSCASPLTFEVAFSRTGCSIATIFNRCSDTLPRLLLSHSQHHSRSDSLGRAFEGSVLSRPMLLVARMLCVAAAAASSEATSTVRRMWLPDLCKRPAYRGLFGSGCCHRLMTALGAFASVSNCIATDQDAQIREAASLAVGDGECKESWPSLLCSR